jgi:hypothetical protein
MMAAAAPIGAGQACSVVQTPSGARGDFDRVLALLASRALFQ